MANAILRDNVGHLSTIKNQNLNGENCERETDVNITTSTTTNNFTKTTHRVVDILCTKPSSADSPQQREKNFQQLPPNTRNHSNETLDLANSYSSSELCLCSICSREYYKFRKIESFTNQNISSSTVFENTSTEDVREAYNLESPSKKIKHKFRVLDALQEIRSPIFSPPLNTPWKGVSLRSKHPYYLRYKIKEYINYTAIRQSMRKTSMNGDNTISNGPLGTLNNSLSSVRNGGTDIHRNNGTTRNRSVMTASGNEKREHLYKILVIGELGTGKTSFIKRYVHQFFSQNYRATIGVDFALKVLHWDQNTIVRLQLWDIAGQERFGNMTRVYYKEAVGAFIVFDVTRSGTFDCVSKWKEDLDSKVQLPDGSPIPCILLANKCDQDKQGVVANAERMDEYVKEHDFAGWFETSAKENINIDEAARALVNKILLNDKLISAADLVDSETINLNNQTATDGKDKCSC